MLSNYDTYLEQKPITRINDHLNRDTDLVAYFSAEYGFHESMPIYAGGLGILAGDYCKAMSNLWVPFVGIGILYHEGYFTQRIDCNGVQVAERLRSDSYDMPVKPAHDADGNTISVQVELPGRQIDLKVWQVNVGHIRLYLLDSDVETNKPEDRQLTAQLYGGDSDMRIQQEIILGIGGVRALRALKLQPNGVAYQRGPCRLPDTGTLPGAHQGRDGIRQRDRTGRRRHRLYHAHTGPGRS